MERDWMSPSRKWRTSRGLLSWLELEPAEKALVDYFEGFIAPGVNLTELAIRMEREGSGGRRFSTLLSRYLMEKMEGIKR